SSLERLRPAAEDRGIAPGSPPCLSDADVLTSYSIFPDFHCFGHAPRGRQILRALVESINPFRVIERSGDPAQDDQLPWSESGRRFRDVGDPQNIEQRGALPVGFRGILEDDLADPVVEERCVETEN